MPRDPNALLPRLWWMRRAQAETVVARLAQEPVPTTEDEVRERLSDLPWSTVTQICVSYLEEG